MAPNEKRTRKSFRDTNDQVRILAGVAARTKQLLNDDVLVGRRTSPHFFDVTKVREKNIHSNEKECLWKHYSYRLWYFSFLFQPIDSSRRIMSTTIIPDSKPVDPTVKTEDVLTLVHELLVNAWGDYDKAGDMEDHAYYAGEIDVLARMETVLTGVEFTLDDPVEEKKPA